MYLHRTMKRCWTEAGEQFPVLLLTGPRQVGKTTLLQHLCGEERRYVTLDDPSLRVLANEDPALFLQRFEPPRSDRRDPVCPAAATADQDGGSMRAAKPGMFWLTGSQQVPDDEGRLGDAGRPSGDPELAGASRAVNAIGWNSTFPPFLPTREIIEQRGSVFGQVGPEERLQGHLAGIVSIADSRPCQGPRPVLQLVSSDLPPAGCEGPRAGRQRGRLRAIPPGLCSPHGADAQSDGSGPRCRYRRQHGQELAVDSPGEFPDPPSPAVLHQPDQAAGSRRPSSISWTRACAPI